MPDIVLKDRNGNDITYPDINSIKVRTTNGDKRTFVHGEMVEKTVAPDFSKGDIEITAAENTFISKVTIEKPEDLSPENIREGKEIGGVAGSAFVVDMVETVILEEADYDGFEEIIPGVYVRDFNFTLVGGETYNVIWGTQKFVLQAAELAEYVYIGNASIVDMGEDTGEPFAVAMGDGFTSVITNESETSYHFGISQTTRGDAEMTTVELDFSNGNMEVTPTAEKVFSKVNIPVPETLVPANIAKDVKIAGIVGKLESGGSKTVVYDDPWLDEICFWDYDGTLILHIPMNVAATFSEMPAPPMHDGLTFLGWNYTLEQINAAEYPLDIGAMYIPTDGKTHLHLSVTNSKYLAMPLSFSQTVSGGVSIDWGDGKVASTVSGTGVVKATHTYSAIGEYDVVITVADGCVMTLGGGTSSTDFIGCGSSNYRNYATELYIGNNVTLGIYAIYQNSYMTALTIPNTIDSIPNYGLYYLSRLPVTVIPSSVTSVGDYGVAGRGQYSVRNDVLVISIPESVVTLGVGAFSSFTYGKRISLPKYITVIPTSALNSPRMLRRVFMSDKVTEIGKYNLNSCYHLEHIKLPESLVTIGDAFLNGAAALKDIKLPRSLTTIGSNVLFNLDSIQELFVPASVVSVGSSSLANLNNSLRRLIVEGTTSFQVQTCDALTEAFFLSDARTSVPICGYYCRVYVPDSIYDTVYKAMSTDYKATVRKLSEYPGDLPTYN